MSWNTPAAALFKEPLAQARFGVVAVVGALALAQAWISPHRPYPAQLSGAVNFRVTSSSDHGAGSLRDALLSADRAGSHARIGILVSKVTLSAPLPPVINPKGVTIESDSGQTIIDAAQVPGVVLEVRAKGVVLQGLKLENATQGGIVLTALGLQISNSTFVNCNTAIEVLSGGGDLLLEEDVFEKNGVGLMANTFEHSVNVRKSKFFSSTQAGIWSVAQGASDTSMVLDISRNQFNDNRFGVVAANHQVKIHDNEITLSHDAGVQIFDRGATVEHNRITDGLAAGIQAESTAGVVIGDNEIYRNRTVAIVMKNSSDSVIRRNNIYSNGNGIAFVFGRADSPNTALQNSIFSQSGDAIVIVGQQPILKENVIRSNNLGAAASVPPAPHPAAATVANPDPKLKLPARPEVNR